MPTTDFRPEALAAHLEAIGCKVPTPIADIVAVRLAAGEAATTQPTDDLAELLYTGKLTTKNAAEKVTATAQALTVRDRAREVLRDLDRPFTISGARAARAHGDEIIAALRTPFDRAAADLEVATADLGPTPEQAVVLAAGTTAAALWHQREAALRTLIAVRRCRVDLATAGYGTPDETAAWWVDPRNLPTPDAIAEATSLYRRSAGFALLIADGRKLRLNTATDVDAILAGARHVATTAGTEADADRHAEFERRKAEHRALLNESEEQARAMRMRIGVTS